MGNIAGNHGESHGISQGIAGNVGVITWKIEDTSSFPRIKA